MNNNNIKTRAAKGSGSIFQASDGKWKGKIQTNNKVKYFNGNTKKEVREKIKNYQFNYNCSYDSSTRVTLEFFFTLWLTTVKKGQLKASSYDRLERTYKSYVSKELGHMYLDCITPYNLQLLINKYAEKYSYSTVKKIYEAIKSCLEYAVMTERLIKNPMAAVGMPKRDNCGKKTKEVVFPDVDEMRKLFEAGVETYGNGQYVFNQSYVDFMRLLSSTGMRAGEALALKNDNIDLENGYIYIMESRSEIVNREGSGNKTKVVFTSPKTKSGIRRINISESTKETVRRIRRRNEDKGLNTDRLICNNNGNLPSVHDMERVLNRMCDHAGIRRIGLHSLRHYFASRYLAKGGDIVALSKHLGHSNTSTTMRIYVHQTAEQEKRLKDVLNVMDI